MILSLPPSLPRFLPELLPQCKMSRMGPSSQEYGRGRQSSLYLSLLAQVGKGSHEGSPGSQSQRYEAPGALGQVEPMRLGVPGCGGGGRLLGPLGEASHQSWWEVTEEAGGLGRLEPSDRPGEPCGDTTEGEWQMARSRSHEPIAEDGRRDSDYKSSFRDFWGKEEEGK